MMRAHSIDFELLRDFLLLDESLLIVTVILRLLRLLELLLW